MKKVIIQLTVLLQLITLTSATRAQEDYHGLYVGKCQVKIGSKDILFIRGNLTNGNEAGYLTIHNTGHIFLTGNLKDEGLGMFKSSSFSNNSVNNADIEGGIDENVNDTPVTVAAGSLKAPRGHIYFVGNTPQTIQSAVDTTIWLGYVHVRNTVKLNSSIRVLGTLELQDNLDLNGHHLYHFLYDDFDRVGNWGRLLNETNTTAVVDSSLEAGGSIKMLKSRMIDENSLGDLESMGMTIAATSANAAAAVTRYHTRDMGVTSGTIRKYFDLDNRQDLRTTDAMTLRYFNRDFDPAVISESGFSIFELRTDNAAPKARRLRSEHDMAQQQLTSADSIAYVRGKRYGLASIHCADAPYVDLGADTLLCEGNVLELKAPLHRHLPVFYEWYREEALLKRAQNDAILAVSEEGNYWLRVTDSRGCESVDSLKVYIGPNPQPEIHADAGYKCESDPFTFWYTDNSPAVAERLSWDFGDATAAVDSLCYKSYAPVCKSYNVSLSVTSTDGCTARGTAVVSVEQRKRPAIRLESLYDTLATFSSYDSLLTCDPGITAATWYVNADSVASGANLLAYPLPGYNTYTIGLRLQGNLCSAYTSEQLTVKVPARPRYEFSHPGKKHYCVGEQVQAVNTSEVNYGKYTYYWNYGNATMSQDSVAQTVVYTTPGTYEISLTMEGRTLPGWRQVYTDTVYVHANPVINFGHTIAHCKDTYELRPSDVQPGYSYEWTCEGATVSNAAAYRAAADGLYSLVVTNETYACRTEESVTLKLNDHLKPLLGANLQACGSTVLDAHNPHAVYQWSTGETTREITVTQSGTYHVYVRSDDGCEGRDTVAVQLLELPAASLGADKFLCDNETLVLQTPANTPGTSYRWSTGEETETITVAGEGVYSVRVSGINGVCEDTASVRVFGLQAPVIDVEGPGPICNGQSVTLRQDNHYYADLIRWTYPGGETAYGATVTTGQTGTHEVYVHYTNGCSAAGSITVAAGETTAVAGFLVSSKVQTNDTLQFINLSYPDPLQYTWELDNTLLSTEENPQLVLHKGAYWMSKDTLNIRLTVNNGGCPVSALKQLIIERDMEMNVLSVRLYSPETGREEVIEDREETPVEQPSEELLKAAVYPNPVIDGRFVAEVELTVPEPLQLSVFSLMGKMMYRQLFEPSAHHYIHITVSDYPQGIYLVHLSAGRHTKLVKILINN